MVKSKLLIIPIALFTALSLAIQPVSARSVGGSSGGRSGGTSVGRSGGGATAGRSVSPSTRSFSSSPSRGYTSYHSVNSSARTAGTTQASARTSANFSNTRQTLGLSGSRSFSSYASHPYSSSYYNNNHYSNVWFYYWVFNNNWTTQQQAQAKAAGISKETATKIYKNTKHITIEKNGEKHVIIVSPTQYNKIKVGDKIKLVNNILTVNGQHI